MESQPPSTTDSGVRRATAEPHGIQGLVSRDEQGGVVEVGPVDEDADVLGEQLPRERAEDLEVEAAAGHHLGGVAASAPAGKDRGEGLLVQSALGRERENLGGEGELGGEDRVVEDFRLLPSAERSEVQHGVPEGFE